MSKHISVATTILDDPAIAASEIDRVLTAMIIESRPVYIGVPADLSHFPIDDGALQTPLSLTLPRDDANSTSDMVSLIRKCLSEAKSPALMIDGCTHRNQCVQEARELQVLLGLPTFVTAMGKGTALEDVPSFGGVYAGVGTHPDVKTAVDNTDAMLWLGRYASDFNTAEFTMTVPEHIIIDIQRFHVSVHGERKVNLKMKYLLQALIEDCKSKPFQHDAKVSWDPYPLRSLPATGPLNQDFLWNALSKFFLPGDCIIGETGTSAFGLGDSFMPEGSFYFNQTVWGSIGYATGSIVGTCQAIAEGAGAFKRGILVTGEGSLHLTAQAIADLLRYDLKPIV